MGCILGIDLGTSSVKAMLLDTEGGVIGTQAQTYDVRIPQASWAEQLPQDWWDGVCIILKELQRKHPSSFSKIQAIGLSGQMHGLVMIDKEGESVHPAILWLDQRSERECASVREQARQNKWDEVLQNRIFPGFALPSLLWVKNNRREVYERIYKIMQPKDYIRYRLTGKIGAEVTDASSALMFDIEKREWAFSVTDALGLDSSLFTECHEPTEIAGSVTPKAHRETGLAEGIPVVYGAGDQQCQGVGNGVFQEGQAICNIGTGGQISVFSDKDIYDPLLRTHTFCHCCSQGYTIYGAVLCAGMALKWLKKNILHEESFEALSQKASQIEAGSEGVFFLPYLAGERTPHMNPEAKGSFFGLQLCHDERHLVRAVMEGVAYALKDSLMILEEMGIVSEEIIASGGACASPVWLQILADVFQKNVRVCEVKEQACMGACILAGIGTGIFQDFDKACKRFVNYEDTIYIPNPDAAEVYQKSYHTFRELYNNLSPLF